MEKPQTQGRNPNPNTREENGKKREFDPQKRIKIFSGCRATGGGIEEKLARGQVRDSVVGCSCRGAE